MSQAGQCKGKKVAILGASGYAGQELRRILGGHKGMSLEYAMTARRDVVPDPPEGPYEPEVQALELEKLSQSSVEGVFLCTPHGAAAELAKACLERGLKVVDLSADFRLKDKELYARTYGKAHPAPELLEEAVYGLTEWKREEIRDARLVANPGCYPSSILLPLLPLLEAGLIAKDSPIVADSKSGVSGAGKTPSPRNVYGAIAENFLAYAVGTHRHGPEIQQEAGTDQILFVPHLLPMFRGLFSTIYLQPACGVDAATVRHCLLEVYASEPFVRPYERGQPELRSVQQTNYCDLAVAGAAAKGQVVLSSALDNLVKGAAGQAVQNMNLMLGLPEAEGLL